MVCCKGTTKAGEPCKARVAKDSFYCFRHAPPPMSAMPVYVDKRPSPPPNARTTKAGKAQPYGKIEKALTVIPFHGEKRATGINGSAPDMVRMPKSKGSLNMPDGWLGALIKKTESSCVLSCCAKGCTAKADVGAHIWLFRGENDEAEFNTAYIVPTCKNHNSRKFDFGKYSNSFVVKAGTPCISMPPHVMYSDFKDSDEL